MQDPFDEDDNDDFLAALDAAEAGAEQATDEVITEEGRTQRTPYHVINFYDRMNPQLGMKGVWDESPQAKAMKALLLREQNVKPRLFSTRLSERFGKLDRKRIVDKLVKEGKALPSVPRNVRETAGTIHPATVDALLDSLPEEAKATPEQITRTIGRLFKIEDYGTIARRTLRSKRFMLNRPGQRLPMHIREGAVLSTAIAIAIAKLFPEQCEPEHLEAVRIMRESAGEIKETTNVE